MSTITPPTDPTRYLTPPSGHGSGQIIWKARMQCGPIIGGADAIAHAITGWSPLEEWVMKPFAGDWDAFDRATQAWNQAGDAFEAVGKNIEALPDMIDQEQWSGEARAAWSEAQRTLSDRISPLPEACRAMGEYSDALGELARAIMDFVLECIKWVSETITRILAEQAVPVVGQVAGGAELANMGRRLVGVHQKIVRFMQQFKAMVEKIKKVIEIVKRAITMIAKLATALSAVHQASTHASDAVNQLGRGGGGGINIPMYA